MNFQEDTINKKEKVYLLDKAVGLEEKERKLVNVEEKMLNLATVKNYNFAGKNCAYNTEISKETVKNKIEEFDFSNIPQEKLEKKVIIQDCIYKLIKIMYICKLVKYHNQD